MLKIVGVRFKKQGKIYFFDPGEFNIRKHDFVIVETVNGEEYGEVMSDIKEMPKDKVPGELKKVVRIANKEDKISYEKYKSKEPEALEKCEELVKKYKLDMKLTDVEYKFDGSKLLFFFTADERIDFRDLVKDLAAIYKTRIEMRQIGVRDEIKRLGGNGICGRELCCCSFLNNFETVSMKMAKEQNLSLNPTKISGNCGRLMCCLKYEQEAYEEKLSRLPKIGAIVKTPDGEGIVERIETLKEIVSVKIKDGEDYLYKKYNGKDIKLIKNVEEEEDM
ncbi:MAG: stage 0 sporulation family protein [Clostridia bacterium]|nr:stage 0 sporulation family protein [Clostridia bacterium]